MLFRRLFAPWCSREGTQWHHYWIQLYTGKCWYRKEGSSSWLIVTMYYRVVLRRRLSDDAHADIHSVTTKCVQLSKRLDKNVMSTDVPLILFIKLMKLRVSSKKAGGPPWGQRLNLVSFPTIDGITSLRYICQPWNMPTEKRAPLPLL